MGLVYDIEIRYLETGNFGGKLGGIGARIKDLRGEFDGLGSSLASGLSGALDAVGDVARGFAGAAVAGAVGIGVMGAAVVGMNDSLEQTQMGLAAIFQAQGQTSTFGQGMAVAAGQIAKMRKDAADLPGEFKDLVDIMQTIAPGAGRNGLGPDATRKIAAQTMSMGAMLLQNRMGMAGREMAEMIEGRANHRNVLANKLGIDPKALNKMSGPQRLELIEKEMGKYDEALKSYRTSFVGLFSTFKDYGRQALTAFGAPLFNSVKKALNGFNDWYTNNKPEIEAYAHYLGQKLANGFEYGVNFFKQYGPAIMEFGTNAVVRLHAAWLRMEPTLARIGDRIKRFLEDPKALDKIENIAKMGLAFKIAAPMVSSMGSYGMQAMGAGISAEGGLAAGGALGTAGLAAAGALVAVAVAAGGMKLALDDQGSVLHGAAEDMWTPMKLTFEDAAKSIKNATSSLEISLLNGAQILGVFITSTLGPALSKVASGIGKAAEFGADSMATLTTTALYGNAVLTEAARNKESKHPGVRRALEDANADKLGPSKVPNSVTNINKVEIIVQSNQDPSRIARLTVDKLADLTRNTKSGFIPKWMGGKN